MSIHIFPAADDTIHALAERIVDIALMSIHTGGRFTWVLAGGHTPRALYETLASDAYRHRVPWEKVFFFLGDERHVPPGDPESNYGMIGRCLLEPLHIPDAQVFPVNTSLAPAAAAEDYLRRIRHFFSGKPLVFDLVLLGLGSNVHTASLFPDTEILTDRQPGIKPVAIEETNSYRISFNAPLLNLACHIAFLVTGADKAMAVHTVQQGKIDWRKFPAQLIRRELTDWYLDEAAAAYL